MEFMILISMLISLVLTLLLEVLIAWLLRHRDKRDLLLLCLVNVITNPAVVLLYHLANYCTKLNMVLVTLFLELMAILIEAYYYLRYGKSYQHPFLFAACANLFSYGIGKLISTLI